MSEYTISYCDCCLPDYFGGHHLPVVQVAVDGAMTLGQLKDDLKGYYAHGHLWEDARFIGGFDHDAYEKAVDSLFERKNLATVAFPDLEVPREDDDWEECYAYFVVECGYEDYETSQVVIPVDEHIVEASLDWATLYDLVKDGGYLTEAQKDELVSLLGSRCRKDTLSRLRRRLDSLPCQTQVLEYPAVAGRMKIYDTYCQYVPGQSYMDEIRLLRKAILD